MGPIVFFMPSVWTDYGNKARIKMFIWAAVFCLCYAGLAFIMMLASDGRP
jgi:hypothetical protein